MVSLQAYVLVIVDIFFGIKMYFMFHFLLVSKFTIGILTILFIYKWYQHLFFQLQFAFIGIIIHFVDFKKFQNLFLKVISKFFKICLICIAYMQGELNISSIHRFMLSVLYILRSLISLVYVVHVCRGNLTSPSLSLIHIWRCRRSTLCRSRWSPYH